MIRMGVLMSNDERYFNNPEQFMPERWMRGKELDIIEFF